METEKNQTVALQYKEITGDELRKVYSDLLDRCFPVPPGSHFFDDFPIWDPQFSIPQVKRFGAFNGAEMVGSAGVRLVQLKTGLKDTVLVALVGAVVTDTRWRSLGLASTMVSGVVKWAEEQGASAILLWGSEHQLYQRLGFELCGEQVQVPLAKILSHSPQYSIPVHAGWNDSLLQLIKKRPGGVVLGETDRLWFTAHKSVEWFYTGERFQPTAYAALGRGIDLIDLVHEWGGNRTSLFEIFRTIHQRKTTISLLGSPRMMSEWGIDIQSEPREFLCMAKILNSEKLITAFYPHLTPSEASVDRVKWIKFILGGSSQLSTDLPKVPFWIWGLDAV